MVIKISSIKINIPEILNGTNSINVAIGEIANGRSSVASLRWQIENTVRGRYNIDARLANTIGQLAGIEGNICAIKRVVEMGANSYNNIDNTILLSGRALFNNLLLGGIKPNNGSFGPIYIAGGGLNEAFTDSKFPLVNDGGFDVSFEGDVFDGELDLIGKAEFDFKEKEFGVEIGFDANVSAVKGKVTGSINNLKGSAEASLVNAGVSGIVGATIYKNGKFAPLVGANISANVNAAQGEVNIQHGNDNFNIHGKAEGELLTAEAQANVGIGFVEVTNDKGIRENKLGVVAEVSAEAYLAKGEVSGGLNIFGIKIDVGIEGKLGGGGVEAGGAITTGKAIGKIGAGLGVGLGLSVSIDWSDISNNMPSNKTKNKQE